MRVGLRPLLQSGDDVWSHQSEALRAKVAEGKVKAVRIDRVLRFDRHDLDRLIDSSK